MGSLTHVFVSSREAQSPEPSPSSARPGSLQTWTERGPHARNSSCPPDTPLLNLHPPEEEMDSRLVSVVQTAQGGMGCPWKRKHAPGRGGAHGPRGRPAGLPL